MGRGGYNGGSTIIRPGMGWFSNDSCRSDPPPRSKSSRPADSIVSYPIVKRRAKRDADESSLRHGYVSSIISAHLTGSQLPKVPKPIRETVTDAIASAGGVLEWAKKHPDFQRLWAKKLRKLKPRDVEIVKGKLQPASVRLEAKKAATPRGSATGAPASNPELEALEKELVRATERLEAAHSRVRVVEAELREVEGRLRFAKRLIGS